MITTDAQTQRCTVGKPTSRRFYIHERSFGSLLSAQPSILRELAQALVLSAASRATEHFVEDWVMFGRGDVDDLVAQAARTLHEEAAAALQSAFQCLVHLVPPRHGATEFLLGAHEQINAWCYEDGYFTYATDEDAARVMYLETGSLRALRSQIRRSPDFDSSLRMISGPSLFLVDHRTGTGPGTASFYKSQHARLIRRSVAAGGDADFRIDDVMTQLTRLLADIDDSEARADLMSRCRRGVSMTLDVLMQSRGAL